MSRYNSEVVFLEDALPVVLDHLKVYQDVVCSTMGPGAGNVCIVDNGRPIVTKDGVTVSNFLKFDDRLKGAVSEIVNDAARTSVRIAGDGTTTTTLLATDLVLDSMKAIELAKHEGKHISPLAYCSALDELEGISIDILKSLRKDVSTQEDLYKVGLIASNGSHAIASVVSDTVSKVGASGSVLIKNSPTEETTVDYDKGYSFETICFDENFLLDKKKGQTLLKDPLVFLADEEYRDYDDVEPIVKAYMKLKRGNESKGKPTPALLMIVSDLFGGAKATILKNMNGAPIFVVKCPDFNRNRAALMEDIREITNTKRVFSNLQGNVVDTFGDESPLAPWKEFGQAKEVTIKRNKCVIKHDYDVTDKVAELKELKAITKEPEERQFLDSRISKLVSGIAIIYVGAFSDTETKNVILSVDDTIRSCFCALREGVLPGGGLALKLVSNELSRKGIISRSTEMELAAKVWLGVLKYPYCKIRENMNYSEKDISLYLDTTESFESLYDVHTRERVDGLEAGIVDPYLVTETALSASVSAAKQIIGTRVYIYSKND